MWPFGSPKISQDDLKRVDRLEEITASMARRIEGMEVDLEEFYQKVNKARQRVVKEERDQARAGGGEVQLTREQQKAALRARLRSGGA